MNSVVTAGLSVKIIWVTLVALVYLTLMGCLNPPPRYPDATDQSSTISPTNTPVASYPNGSNLYYLGVSPGQATLINQTQSMNIRVQKSTALQSDGGASVKFGRQRQ